MQISEEEFKNLIHRHKDLIWSVCKHYRLSAAWQTEDAFNEVLCALWQGYGSFDGKSKERTWVFKVANNTMISIARRLNNQHVAAPSVPEQAYGREDSYHLRQMIDTLDEPDKTILKSHLYGFSYAEIAKSVGLSAGAVSMRLTRTIRKLRKIYNQ
jgi:RNA polymerase sigma-70 factor (ECF subfamily)